MIKKYLFLFVLFIAQNIFSQVQNQALKEIEYSGSIIGKITDSIAKTPIEYTSISLFLEETNKVINGSTSDSKGNFKIQNIPNGNYKLAIYFIGYKNRMISNIVIDSIHQKINLGDLYITTAISNLEEVVIKGKTALVEYKIDKTVYNVENDVTSQGGAAIDILKKVPQVNVDINGNVELQGNSNIRFLINGKPSSIFGNSLADALASIPASQIKSIEAITSPGAKYDVQGTGGIINIILKENKVQGINGNINLSAGTRFETSSLNLSTRKNKFGMNIFFGGNAQLTSHTPNSQNRTSTDSIAQINAQLIQNGTTDFRRNGFNTGASLEWNINTKNSITSAFTYNQFENNNINNLNQEQISKDYTTSTVLKDVVGTRNSINYAANKSVDWNINYRKVFKKEGQELTISYITSYGKPNSNYIQTQSIDGEALPFNGTKSNNIGKDNNQTISIDYIYPIKKNFLVETGVKHTQQDIISSSNIRFLDISSNEYVNSPLESYHLNYGMKIYAGYLSSTFTLYNWLNVKIGLRDEYTGVKIDYQNTTVPSYNILSPSISLSHKFSKEQQLKFAYTRRIERPEYTELNPFVNLSDPHNISTGNTQLRPEIGNNFELGFSKNFSNDGNIYIGLIERINTQDLKQITTFYPSYLVGDSIYSNVSVTTRQNIGAEYNSGMNISASIPIANKFVIRGNINCMNRYVVSPVLGNIEMGFRERVNLNLTYNYSKSLIFEAFGNYNSSAKNVQGVMPQSLTYTIAFKKVFWNKKASFGFTTTNAFNKYVKQETTTITTSYVSDAIRQLPYRSLGINFTYKFGKLEFKKTKEEPNDYLNNLPN